MKNIHTIGIIGMGAVGMSTAYILQKAGLNVLGFKHESRNHNLYEKFIANDKIEIVNHTANRMFPKSDALKIKLTTSLGEIVEKADLILNCCRFPQNSTIYQFSASETSVLREKHTPILIFPGKIGATYLLGAGNLSIGLIGYSPAFATKKVTPHGITVNLLDFKSNIPLAHDDPATRRYLLHFLNEHIKFKQTAPTFMDGGCPIQTTLSSPVPAINAAAICDNAVQLIRSGGKPITEEIYVLSVAYAQLFQQVFEEQVMVAKKLKISSPRTLKDWLKNRTRRIQSESIATMLAEVYQGKYVTISIEDRRITESYYALLFFKHFANALGCSLTATEELLHQIETLQQAMDTHCLDSSVSSSICQAAVLYAKHIQDERELRGNRIYAVSSY